MKKLLKSYIWGTKPNYFPMVAREDVSFDVQDGADSLIQLSNKLELSENIKQNGFNINGGLGGRTFNELMNKIALWLAFILNKTHYGINFDQDINNASATYVKLENTNILPNPSVDYLGCLVMHSGYVYYCDGTAWKKITAS